MVVRASSVAVITLLAHGGCAAAAEPRLTPTLKPESHDEFFDHDYTADHRPTVHKSFGFKHPYPVMQDSEDYDSDFIKDENKDNGHWQAQEAYDSLRGKRSKKEAEAMKAWQVEKDLEHSLAKAKLRQADAEHDAKQAADEADTAKRSAELAQEKAKGLASMSVMKSEVDAAVKAVEGDVTDLDDCKRKLSIAKEHLKQLMKEKEDHQGARVVEAEQAQTKALEAKGAADNLSAEAEAKSAAAAALRGEAAVEDAKLQTKIGEARERAEQLEKQVKEGEDAIKSAAVGLHSFRRTQVDNGGGVYYITTPAPVYVAPAPAPLPSVPAPAATTTNTPDAPAPPKSGAAAVARLPLVAAILAFATALRMA